jgi:hypothetical protein
MQAFFYVVWGYKPFELIYAVVEGLSKKEVEEYIKIVLSSSFEIYDENEFLDMCDDLNFDYYGDFVDSFMPGIKYQKCGQYTLIENDL